MCEVRGSAVAVAALVGLLLLYSQVVDSATYTVGGGGGWSVNVSGWPKGKSFKAGDILVFNYNSNAHNVIPVNKAAYTSCSAPQGAKVYKSGKDQIKLVKGQNYFLCGVPGHCQAGMKIAVTAA